LRPTILVRTMLAAMLVLCGVGALEAGRGDEWDLVVLFGGVAVLTVVLLIRTAGSRQLVPVRADLVRWMASRAAVAGERTEDLADRAVAAYRDGLTGEDPHGHERNGG
jgi:hypothetical protein